MLAGDVCPEGSVILGALAHAVKLDPKSHKLAMPAVGLRCVADGATPTGSAEQAALYFGRAITRSWF
jgi:hypothetical protein